MNDFEQKLARQTFREPPAGLRAQILRACAEAAPPAWTWRNWLWPSPPAWAALTALWLLFAAIQFADRAASPTAVFATSSTDNSTAPTALYSMHNPRDFRHVLDLAN